MSKQKTEFSVSKKNKAVYIGVTICTVILLIFLAIFYYYRHSVIPSRKYDTAMEYMQSGEYEKAIPIFNDIKYIKKCFDKLDECRYQVALNAIDDKDYDKAYHQLIKITDCSDDVKKLKNEHKEAAALIECFLSLPTTRVELVQTEGNSVNKVLTTEYSYDKNGRLLKEKTDKSEICYSYNKKGLLDTVTENGKVIAKYSYDNNGNKTSELIFNKKYEYDVKNRLASVTSKDENGNETIHKYKYGRDSQLIRIETQNSIAASFTYTDNDCTNIDIDDSFFKRQHTFDDNNNCLSLKITRGKYQFDPKTNTTTTVLDNYRLYEYSGYTVFYNPENAPKPVTDYYLLYSDIRGVSY